MFLGIPLAFGLAVPVVFRRKYPIAAYYTAIAAGGVQVALDIRPAATDVAILILLYTLAAYYPAAHLGPGAWPSAWPARRWASCAGSA